MKDGYKKMNSVIRYLKRLYYFSIKLNERKAYMLTAEKLMKKIIKTHKQNLYWG